MEQIYHIRNMYYTEGKSIRQIARETGCDRGTISKYIAQEDFSMTPPLHQRRRSKTDAYRETVRAWLLADEDAPRKQRHTAHRVYKRLVEEAAGQGFMLDVSERSIRNLVADLKRELLQQELVALPLLHPAGEAQVDFGEVTFYERGIRYEGHHLCLVLPHSDAKYTQLFKGQVFECLGQGLVDIFTHLGGVPPVIRFDNMSTAVKAIRALGERELTENFRRLQCHYGFTSNFCNPASGHEKGAVENYVGNSRRNLFVPMPEIEDLEAYNKELLATCDAHLEKVHYKLERLVGDLLKEDQARFIPLPADPFDACRYVPARTDNYGKAIFQTNKYSTAGLLPQGGISIGLSVIVRQQLPEYATAIITIIMFSVLIYETTGPIFAKIAIQKAGEIGGLDADLEEQSADLEGVPEPQPAEAAAVPNPADSLLIPEGSEKS